MEIRIHHFCALLCSVGLISAMAGCAPEETSAITEDGTESAAVPTDGAKEPGTQPELWNGLCCWWTCDATGGRHNSPNPVWGECQSYGDNWCLVRGQGASHAHEWATCQ
jgi:hypothetical protein